MEEGPKPQEQITEPQNETTPPTQSRLIGSSRWRLLLVLALLGVSFAGGYVVRDWVAPPTEARVSAAPSAVGAQTGGEATSATPQTSNVPQGEINVGNTSMSYSEFEAYLRDVDDNDPAIGPPDAPITIVEFSDFECPYCKRFRDQTLTRLLNTYEGLIRFVYRDFPLTNVHPRAQIAAEAAECANDQGKYWLMHDVLFEDQASWQRAPNVFDRFRFYAEQLRMDAERLVDCISSGKYTNEVALDQQAGIAYGVRGTPSFIINGTLLRGAVPFELFQQVLERELTTLSQQAESTPSEADND